MAVAYESPPSPAAEARTPSRAYAWYVLLLLTALNALNLVDRKLPFIMVERIRRDFPLTDTQVGLLGGLAFTLLYSVLGFPIARLADRMSRRLIIVGSVSFWSAMTALGGLSHSFLQFAGSRFGLAFGEAGCTPASQSMISDYFRPERRHLAMSVLQAGSGVGVMAGLAAGGLLVERLGWRASLGVVGAVGVGLALLSLLTVKEPQRGAIEARGDTTPASLRDSLRLFRARRSFKHLAATGALYACTTAAVITFTPSYLVRSMGFSIAQSGAVVGFGVGLTASLGVLAGGWIASTFGKADARRVLWTAAVGLLVACPLLFLAYHTGSRPALIGLLAAALFASSLYIGPNYALAQNMVPPNMRAFAAALLLFVVHGIGTSAGPLLVGMLSDHFAATQGPGALRTALLIASAGYVLGAVPLLFASRTIRADLAAGQTVVAA